MRFTNDRDVLCIFAPMGTAPLEITEFVRLAADGFLPLIDARSESEFRHAHVPGAINIPILNDVERKEVGTIYKQQGKNEAVLAGFRLVGPRFHDIIINAREKAPNGEVIMYCWRGGMRSQILAWVLQMNGFKVRVLTGGYKTFRNWVLETVQLPLKAVILGGPTGSGKTELLDHIKNLGHQVLQLEELANHKGSAFGALGKTGQPSNEQFENSIAMEISRFDITQPVWIENESRSIGSNLLPPAIYEAIRTSSLLQVQVGVERRKQRILEEYGIFPTEVLAATTEKIGRRLGPQHLKQALSFLHANDLEGWLDIVLHYYDKLYAYGTSQRKPEKCFDIDLETTEFKDCADKVIQYAATHLIHETTLKES